MPAGHRKAGEMDNPLAIFYQDRKKYQKFRRQTKFRVACIVLFQQAARCNFQLHNYIINRRPVREFQQAVRYMVAASILYHQLLLAGFMPRGGLGFGLVLRRKDMVLGGGFLDAYNVAEKRSDELRHICAIELSSNFCLNIANTEHSWRLVCLYKEGLPQS